MRILLKLLGDRRGATAIEYAGIASLISVAAVAAFHNLGDKVEAKFGVINEAVSQTM